MKYENIQLLAVQSVTEILFMIIIGTNPYFLWLYPVAFSCRLKMASWLVSVVFLLHDYSALCKKINLVLTADGENNHHILIHLFEIEHIFVSVKNNIHVTFICSPSCVD